MISLNARITITASVVVAVFVVLTALALDQAFQQRAEAAVRDRLFAQLYLLMADAELDSGGNLQMPTQSAEPRLGLPGSGLYAVIRENSNRALWRSASAVGLNLTPPPIEATLNDSFSRRQNAAGDFFTITMGIEWEVEGKGYPLHFTLYEDLHPFETELNRYRYSLWGWLGAMALLLLITQAAALAWGLKPLRTVSREVKRVESGEQQSIHEDYPRELRRLTANINTLLHHERAQQTRYRDALADLAHSLKTPLAVLRGIEADANCQQPLQEQVQRMDEIVQHQLQRASTAGRSALAAPIDIAPVVERLLNTLNKVHHSRNVTATTELEEGASFRGDEGDLMELLGNLLDNAYKWAKHRVTITSYCQGERLQIHIEDDGPGIADEQQVLILKRGARLDQQTPGHGIGLAMVMDIIDAYEGSLNFMRSEQEGTKVVVKLPGCDH
ncbi:hypothetical protein BOW53_07765 [Solemya pervernicosa gill symbiont]|uniref:histidine kinase n=2 Tax=Gammaproteobacteria incertae sedis TaxID=118884 RepID=A0A1T2L5Q8_9GAMM|nr:ATP-binding protein [Candidatus Reidiella endopervernicosa]OOZ40458.1 hypothetical protein BOW53_07765 [Solemya pervernicosa gill symbiont]QKQ25376.1 GHKL domain-containing protein [Candidatus Reidiella endopervernicosa]